MRLDLPFDDEARNRTLTFLCLPKIRIQFHWDFDFNRILIVTMTIGYVLFKISVHVYSKSQFRSVIADLTSLVAHIDCQVLSTFVCTIWVKIYLLNFEKSMVSKNVINLICWHISFNRNGMEYQDIEQCKQRTTNGFNAVWWYFFNVIAQKQPRRVRFDSVPSILSLLV